jgi:hypothetical protein
MAASPDLQKAFYQYGGMRDVASPDRRNANYVFDVVNDGGVVKAAPPTVYPAGLHVEKLGGEDGVFNYVRAPDGNGFLVTDDAIVSDGEGGYVTAKEKVITSDQAQLYDKNGKYVTELTSVEGQPGTYKFQTQSNDGALQLFFGADPKTGVANPVTSKDQIKFIQPSGGGFGGLGTLIGLGALAFGLPALGEGLVGLGGLAEGAGALGAASDLGLTAGALGGEYLGGLGATGALTGGISDAALLGGEYAGGLGAAGAGTAGVTVGSPISSGAVTESTLPGLPSDASLGPDNIDAGGGWNPGAGTGGPQMPSTPSIPGGGSAATSGPGYYDEVTGKWVSDPNGPLQGPLDPSQSGNVSNMDGWTADPSTGTWTDPSGTQYQSTPWNPNAPGISGADLLKNAGALPSVPGTSKSGGSGLTTAGALAGLGGLAGLLALIKSDSSRYGTPGRQNYTGPLSQYKFNPSAYQASAPNSAMFRPQGGVTTVADQLAAAQQSPLAQLAAMSGDRQRANPMAQMAQMAGLPFAKGGSTSKRPEYTAKPKLASMDPWTRAAAEYENAAYRAQSPTAPTAAPVGPQLGQLNLRSGGELGNYSDGGHMLKGPGDGMSDSIPATIGGKRPARLADGEFVVPADVVSHLGNGSTEAGARELYKMLDKVRHARTGNKKQGKQINPGKFLPK